MLDNLDTINWSEMRESYGASAARVPELIRSLLSEDQMIRDKAHDQLSRAINNTYIVGTASLAAIPFLIKLLEFDETPDKAKVLFLLGEMLVYPVDVARPDAQLRVDVATAIWTGFDIYVRLLRHNTEGKVQYFAASLLFELRCFPAEFDERLQHLYAEIRANPPDEELIQEFPKWDKIWLDSATGEDENE